MSPELDKKLCEDFPKIFKDRHADMRTTAMCLGFECGDGWYEIIRECCEKLSKLDDVPVAVQVKEKYGTLRFYIYGGSPEADDIIGEAEDKSEVTCEVCGAAGELRGGGWLYVSCSQHMR